MPVVVGRSFVEIPKSMLAINRVAISAEGMPMAIPNSANTSASLSTIHRTERRCAPSATRMPISRVRRATV